MKTIRQIHVHCISLYPWKQIPQAAQALSLLLEFSLLGSDL